jgi:hypothetical protein
MMQARNSQATGESMLLSGGLLWIDRGEGIWSVPTLLVRVRVRRSLAAMHVPCSTHLESKTNHYELMVGDAELGAVSFGALRRVQRAKTLGACT